ncbi:sensor histidine kinase [Salinicoccus halodurans]|nr:sensor histidine kinase [Salinicoccus halodurans]
MVILIIFLIWDFFKGRQYRLEFMNLENIEEVDTLPLPETPYQKTLDAHLDMMHQAHNLQIEQESRKTRENLDEMTRWIHDMKMPMTTMKLMIDGLDGDQKLKIEEEWQRMDAMLNEMLYSKRLTNISNDLYIETVDLEQIVNSIIRKFRIICMQKGIGFDVTLHAAEVQTDLKWCTFVLEQVISNSVKYTEEADIAITSDLIEGWITLEISDEGRGIRKEDLPRIFEAGFTSTSDHGDAQSTGMGLYLAHEAAEAMHIQMRIESEYGRGTTTKLTFPDKNALQKVETM